MRKNQYPLNRRQLLAAGVAALLAPQMASAKRSGSPQPVILDTDIGDDIDDTWALLMLLRAPEVDLQLVVGDYQNPMYRGRLLAKLLQSFGHSEVPVGLGVGSGDFPGQQSAWLGDYNLADYPGKVYEDGVQAIIDTIKASPVPVTLLCLGPVPNIAEALRREPSIAQNARFVGMYGSIFTGYLGEPTPVAEYNVRVDPASLQRVFEAEWECTITPLDTCGLLVLDGESYQRIYQSNDPSAKILIDNYRAWLPGAPFIAPNHDLSKVSTTLFDAVAVHLVTGGDYVELQELPIRVTDDGYTVIDPHRGRPVHCAVAWKDKQAFEAELVATVLDQRSN